VTARTRPMPRLRFLGGAVSIIIRRGVVDPGRPLDALRAVRTARRAGPFPAMIVNPARRSPSSPAISDEHGTLTYGELEARSNALARGLGGAGVRAGDVVGLLCRNHRGMVLSIVAATKLGARIVLINTGFGRPQLEDVVAREHVSALVLDPEFSGLTDARAPVRRVLASLDEPGDAGIPAIGDLLAGQPEEPVPLPDRPGGMVLLSSGTTGAPKGASRDKVSPFHAAQMLDRLPLAKGGTMVVAAPLFHGTGLQQVVIALTLAQEVVVRRRFEPEAVLAQIAAHRADSIVLVPTMLQRILDLGPGTLARYDTSSLRTIACGGSALSPELCRRTAEAFGDVLHNIYGSTEVAIASVATPGQLRQAPGTVGSPPIGSRVALYDEDRNPVVEPHRRGTIFVGGLSVAGYTDGGGKEVIGDLVSTGDVGHLDEEGRLFVDGRDDDMIVSGGENVFPQEVEHLLAEHPDVEEVAVVGVDDAEFGQRLRAVVALRPGAGVDAQDLKEHVRTNLARHKVPRDVVFVDRLPRNATGKVVRRELQDSR
jgi:fatty-acyl-CoA synthase